MGPLIFQPGYTLSLFSGSFGVSSDTAGKNVSAAAGCAGSSSLGCWIAAVAVCSLPGFLSIATWVLSTLDSVIFPTLNVSTS